MNVPPELIESLLTKSSAAISASAGFESADQSALYALNRLTQQHLQLLIHRILSFSKTNRRQRVSYDDIELALFMEQISLPVLEAEFTRLRGTPMEDFSVSEQKVAKGFESIDRKIQNQLLGPDLNGRKRGIPGYMEKGMILPALPPLHTHYMTPVYVERETGPRHIREGMTRESVAIEGSLKRLIEIEESTAAQAARKRHLHLATTRNEVSKHREHESNHNVHVEEVDVKNEVDDDNEDDEDENVAEDVDTGRSDRLTNVMKDSIKDAEKRKKRADLFAKVWMEMGYEKTHMHRRHSAHDDDGEPFERASASVLTSTNRVKLHM